VGGFFSQVGSPDKAGRTEPGTPPPTVAKPQGRLHQVGIKALQSNTSFLLIESYTAEERASGVLQPRDPELRVMVRGPFTLESNAIEHLSVRIDGIPYKLPDNTFGNRRIDFDDAFTLPPAAPAKPAAAKRSR